ncbi:carboxy terminal-processing peptidase [Chryseolinea lacunae]|uniref:Carboxy terminal-processing peptidase n=1 Tax=Chryseolinea lacunae TaxID=2801331 RepID=A0ABS1KV76_9BACT|nr:carboxy terminal-processing peptidase [Chryseolinea lacunae]MBL0743127.1 carboxy terminal-processing peptidase [Chryseolinea lacunae]
MLTTLAFAWAFDANAQTPINFKTEAQLLKKVIQQKHYNPPPLNDAYSARVFDDFLDDLDPDRMLFTAGELKSLLVFRDKLDDELNGNNWVFLPTITQTYKKCLARAASSILQHTQSPFDLKTKETLPDDTTWAADEAALQTRWRLDLKLDVLARLADMKRKYPAEAEDAFLKKHEPEAREQAKANNIARGKRILFHPNGYDNYVGFAFLHAMANSVDAHTNYFSPKEMESFMGALSTEGFFFGVTLKENELGEVVIDKLTPGGPAWKSGVVYVGDVVQRLRWEGREWMDLFGLDLEEAGNIMEESNQLALDFELRNVSGQQKTVRLRKEKISDEDNIVKSFVMQGQKKIGYIFLPGFYSNWGDAGGARCANDVAKEILKLKKENIEGLVLDVRFNGGGSLEEAVAMAGIFIDAGPMGVLKDKTGNVVSVKDMNRGTIYDGPLVLMVNALSASASEFLAAALQDYRRAIVVGGRTYGKATAQELFALDLQSTAATYAKRKSLNGYSAVTLEKIYRVSGKTAQRKGVTPDILLPDMLEGLSLREENNASPVLPSDSIAKKTYYQPLTLLPLHELKAKSALRVSASSAFRAHEQYGALLKEMHESTEAVPLHWTEYVNWRNVRGKNLQEMEKQLSPLTSTFTVTGSNFEQQRLAIDEYGRNFNETWIKKLQQDISLEEAFYILCDYINQKKK